MKRLLKGIVRGRTIELTEDPGLPEGETVQIVVNLPARGPWGEGILKSAGGWADIPERDAILNEIQRSRSIERTEQDPDPTGAFCWTPISVRLT